MKKIIVLSMFIVFMATLSFSDIPFSNMGEEKRINVFGGVGTAISDLEGCLVEIGIEKQFSGDFYGQLSVDYYFNPEELDDSDDSYAFSTNLFGVYKFPVSRNLNFYLKGGIHLTGRKEEWTYIGTNVNLDYGLAGGGGIEFMLSNRVAIYSGVTAKTSLDENRTWFKFHGGISIQVQ